ncbi:MAG: hypothetical protein JXR76_31170 [Deltaproteobacteria bacterium]|nr:hypothetical protein [Deltaproteobacteria bacterium]
MVRRGVIFWIMQIDSDTDRSTPLFGPYTMILPNATAISEVVAAANGDVVFLDRARIFAAQQKITGNGTGGVSIGMDNALTVNIVSSGPVKLLPRSTLNGDIDCATNVVIDGTASLFGQLTQNASFDAAKQVSLNLDLPWPVSSDRILPPGQSVTVAPGTYNNLHVFSNANARLSAGEYRLTSLQVEPQGIITIDDTAGPRAGKWRMHSHQNGAV